MPPKGNSGGDPPDEPKDNSNHKLYLELRPLLLQQLSLRYPQFAEDAIQETYLAVTRTGVRLEEQADPQAYLFSVAINEIRQLASRSRRLQPDQTDLDLIEKHAAQAEGDISEAVIGLHDLEKALAGLTELESRVLDLNINHDLPARVIAQLLNISPRKAQRALTNALRQAKAALSHTTQGRPK